MKRANDAGLPFFVWLDTTHMHACTHTTPQSLGQAGRRQSFYHDAMVDDDKLVGDVLDYLDELGIADDTFVMYSTDNGPHRNSWPDAGHDRPLRWREQVGDGRDRPAEASPPITGPHRG